MAFHYSALTLPHETRIGMKTAFDLDTVLEELGSFGRFQKQSYVLFTIVMAFSMFSLSYVFTTRNTAYRCMIEECEGIHGEYNAQWMRNAIPYENHGYSNCKRYVSTNLTVMENVCSSETFDVTEIVTCSSFIFEPGSNSIEKDFNITCDENLWKLTIVGSLVTFAELMNYMFCGSISDRYGRKTTMMISICLNVVLGSLKSFASSYNLFVFMEFIHIVLSSGMSSSAYVLAMELVEPKQRVLGNSFISFSCGMGQILLSFVAWNSPSWRILLRILYLPSILFLLYFWFTQESVRWLISKGYSDKAKLVLKKIAKTNNKSLPDEVIQKLMICKAETTEQSFLDVYKSKILFRRLLICIWIWTCSTFVYFGLIMHSVAISGNMYINFMAVGLIEWPATILAYFMLDRFGRKKCTTLSLIASGCACFLFVFVHEEHSLLQLMLFLIGKLSMTISFLTLYIYTSEMFPTNLRHSLLGICCMFGRLVTMAAPQIPHLAKISKSLPLLLFGVMATSSGALSVFLPETLNTKLPDTIEEAVRIDKKYNIVEQS